MVETKYILVPFASEGDTNAIPTDTQGDGSVSWSSGWGPDYQRDLSDDPNAKAIERRNMNQLFFVLSSAIKQYQENGFPNFITSDENNGNSYPYNKGNVVTYINGDGNREFWVSVIDGNRNDPGGEGWERAPYRVANSAEISAREGLYPITPQQAVEIFNAVLSYPDATLTQKGIVQLNDSANSTSTTQAATANAVSKKLTHEKTDLDTKDLNTLKAFNQRAIYFQTNADLATPDRNYPVQAAGVLMCLGQVNSAVMQMYYGENGTFHMRSMGSNETFNPWREITPVIQNATVNQTGVTRLSNELYGDREDLAATPRAVGNKLNYNKSTLGTRSLDNITDASETGVYYQNTANNATVDRGYPLAGATGQLIVTVGQDGWIQQTYNASGGSVYMRSKANAQAAEFSTWNTTPPGMPTGAIVPFALAGNGNPPAGYLICNGAQFRKTEHPALAEFLGDRYARSNDNTTDLCRLPKYVDGDAMLANNGTGSNTYTVNGSVGAHGHTGSTNTTGNHSHSYQFNGGSGRGGGGGVSRHADDRNTVAVQSSTAGAHMHNVTIPVTGPAENRAAGFKALVCIKT